MGTYKMMEALLYFF